MSDNSTKLNVYQRLQKARVELQNKNIKKSGKNKYSGFTYFELADFIPSINEIFLKLGLSSNFSIQDDLANLFIINTDNLEDNILFTSPIKEASLKGCVPIQEIGAIHTYMRRYLYLNALEIVEPDRLDPEAGKPQENKNTKPQQTTKPEASLISILLGKFKNKNMSKEQIADFCKLYNVNSKNEKTIEDFFKLYDADALIDEYIKWKSTEKEPKALEGTLLNESEVANG